MKKKTLLVLAVLFALLTFLAAGCKKDNGWKAQSAPKPNAGTSASSNEPVQDNRPTSVGVSSFLHDLFGTSLPADTDRYLLPFTEEEKRFKLDDYIHYADAYGDTMYFIRLDDPNVYAFDFMAGEERVFAADAVKDPAAICTDADGIYVADVGAKEVVYFTFDGARAGSVALPEEPKANLDGPEGYAWMLEKYYPSVRHYDGLLLLAARDAIWTIADGETEWQRAEYPFVNGEFVDAAAILSRNRIAVYTTRCLIRVPVLNRVTEMNRKGEEQKLLYDQSVQAMSANNGCLYITTGRNGTVRLFEIGTGQVVFLQNLDTKPNAVVNFAVSGGSVFIKWVGKKVDLIPGTENYLLALPPAAMKHPAQVESFLFVNVKSPRIEAALSLLADLTNGENRYNAAIYPTPLFPDVTSYYKYEIYDAEKDEWFDTPRKMPAFRGEYLDFAMRLEQLFETFYLHSEPALIAPSQKAWDAVSDFCTGKMTGEDCAKVLYEEFVYRIKG